MKKKHFNLQKTKKQIVMDEYQNYIQKINNYNKKVYKKNIIIKKKIKKLKDPIIQDINKFIRDSFFD